MVSEADADIKRMEVFNPLIEPTVTSAIQTLQLPEGSHGLDAGCGIGLETILLAEAVGSTGHIIGLDISSEFLIHAEKMVKESSLRQQISFQHGNVSKIPFDDDSFDWAWSSHCVGYAATIDPLLAMKELVRVVKPGGCVGIFAWSSEQLLPGYPVLEARLNATSPGIAPFVKGRRPELHFTRALGWFHEAGLKENKARAFAGGAYAPLSNDLRDALRVLFAMRWPGVESELKKEDWFEYQRLCLPESPEFVLNSPDYYTFFTCSMFWGKVS